LSRFRYALDPLCVAATACYAGNRWLLPADIKGLFLNGYFSDLLLLPAALPLLLWLQRRLGLRLHDSPPSGAEVGLHVIAWSITAEVIAPLLFARATADWWDTVAYLVGGVIAWLFWSAA
jgi:hypothetical protein